MKFCVEMQLKYKSVTVQAFGNIWERSCAGRGRTCKPHTRYHPEPTSYEIAVLTTTLTCNMKNIPDGPGQLRAQCTMREMEGLIREKGGVFSGICASFHCRASASIPASARELVGVREVVFGIMTGCHHMVMWSKPLWY